MQDSFMPQFGGGANRNQNNNQNHSDNFSQPNNTFGTPASSEPPAFQSTSQFPGGPTPPKEKKPLSVNTKLVFLSVALGVIALIAIVVSVWLLINQNQTKKQAADPGQSQTPAPTQDITAETFGFYPGKIINPSADVIYRLGVHRITNDGNGVFGAYISTDNSAVDLYIYWSYITSYYGLTTEKTDRELAKISFEQPVVDIAIGETGQNVSGDVLLFLLADGTVEYLPVVKALTNNDFRSYGQLAGVTDVVKFYRVDAVSDTGDWQGYASTLAQRDDGSIVDLQGFMLTALKDESTDPIEDTPENNSSPLKQPQE